MAEASRFLIDDVERAAMLLRGADPSHAEQLGKHADLRERRAQLVRDAGHEVGAQARERGFASQLSKRDRD